MDRISHIMLLAIAGVGLLNPIYALGEEKEKKVNPYEGMPTVTVKGTNRTASFTVKPKSLSEDIILKTPVGFTVTPTVIPAGTTSQNVTVKYTGYNSSSEGSLILKSGENRTYVHLVGLGTSLPTKDNLPKASIPTDGKFSTSFSPGTNGFTYEFSIASNEDGFEYTPYFVDNNGNGLKLYISDSEFGFYNGRYKRTFNNPSSYGVPGGKGRFYNNDGKSHTYRIAVTPDKFAYIYRDGIAVDTLNISMLSPQPEFEAKPGAMSENLLKNGDFEGGYKFMTDNILGHLDGWDIVIHDRWNSEQYIEPEELSSDIDLDNHVFKIQSYKWGDGWGDGGIEQIVDVVPGETYTLEALAHGGQSAKKGKNLAKISIRELKNDANRVETEVVSDMWETYSLDYTPSADCHQISILFSIGKGTWGHDIKPLYIDNVRLVGTGAKYSPLYGFINENAALEYVAFDESGAYAPSAPEINVIVK